MSGRGPDPKELRPSLVDTGWSVTPPPPALALKSEKPPRPPSQVPLPPPPRAPRIESGSSPRALRTSTLPGSSAVGSARPPAPARVTPPPVRSSRPPPLPSAAEPTHFVVQSMAAVAASPLSAAPLTHASAPSPPRAGAAPSPAVASPTSGANAFASAPAAPSFAPAIQRNEAAEGKPPSLLAALGRRVAFAGGEVPLWTLLSPMVMLLALGAAFAAAAWASPARHGSRAADATPPLPITLKSDAAASALGVDPAAPATSSVFPGDTAAEALEARKAEELTRGEALELAAARRARDLAKVRALQQKVAQDPALYADSATLSELRRAAEDPLTAPNALFALSEAPGRLGPDLLYEVWTGTVARSRATELARSLVFSREVRARASAALQVALDLRTAETCEQNLQILKRALDIGDRRSLALVGKLTRRFGCGPNKRLDCNPCLRGTTLVDDAFVALKKRREPKPFAGSR